jgi:hypothetical protein
MTERIAGNKHCAGKRNASFVTITLLPDFLQFRTFEGRKSRSHCCAVHAIPDPRLLCVGHVKNMIYLLTAIGLSPGCSSTVHIYTQAIHRTTQNKQYVEQHNNLGKCGPCPVLASYTLAFALQLRKKHGKTSVRVVASKNT